MSNQTGSEKNAESDLTSIAPIVVKPCHPAVLDGASTVTKPANRQLTGNAARHDVTAVVTFSTGKGNNVTVKSCAHCDGDFETKRPKQARYCGPQCRRAAWLLRNPDKAAALAVSDRQRLRLHLESRGIVWQERYTNER
jgi:hypothetical protein